MGDDGASNLPFSGGILSAPYPLPLPVVPTALLFLILATGNPGVDGCLHCGGHFKNLRIRFTQLCIQYRKRYGQANCTKHPWGRESAQDLALDEESMDLLMEKTHRVFRVIEINQSLVDFPRYWNWLYEVKMPAQNREARCPPACEGFTSAVNCSTCRKVDVPCWDLDTCYPNRKGLEYAVRLLIYLSGSCLLLGVVSCALEFWLRPGIGTE